MLKVGVAGTMTGARHVLQPSSIEKSLVCLRFQYMIVRQILQVYDPCAISLPTFKDNTMLYAEILDLIATICSRG